MTKKVVKRNNSNSKDSNIRVQSEFNMRLLSAVVNASSTPVNSPMGAMEVVKVTANFTAPAGLPSGVVAFLQIPSCKLQRKDATGNWQETGLSKPMNFVGTNSYEVVFEPQMPGDFQGVVTASWSVSGSIPDGGPSNTV